MKKVILSTMFLVGFSFATKANSSVLESINPAPSTAIVMNDNNCIDWATAVCTATGIDVSTPSGYNLWNSLYAYCEENQI